MVGARLHRRAAERARDGAEFGGEGGGLIVLTAGQQHLHSGRQQLRAVYWVAGLAEQPPDGRDGRLGAALGQPEQGQPGLRLDVLGVHADCLPSRMRRR